MLYEINRDKMTIGLPHDSFVKASQTEDFTDLVGRIALEDNIQGVWTVVCEMNAKMVMMKAVMIGLAYTVDEDLRPGIGALVESLCSPCFLDVPYEEAKDLCFGITTNQERRRMVAFRVDGIDIESDVAEPFELNMDDVDSESNPEFQALVNRWRKDHS